MSSYVKTTDNLPDELCEPEGFIGALVQHMRQTAEYDLPEFFLGAALSLLSVITARKIEDYRGSRTNLYSVAIGPTGCGKEHARKINRSLLSATQLEGPGKFTSGSAIVSALDIQPALLCMVDEIGSYLKAACSEKAPPHLAQVVSVLTEAFTSSGSVWRPQGYADVKNSKTIDQPSLTLYGTTTSSTFFEGLNSNSIESGFLGRVLVFLSPGGGYVRCQEFEQFPVPERITAFVQRWLDMPHGPGNLSASSPMPSVLKITPEARLRLKGHFFQIADQRIGEEPTAAAIWSRTAEKTSKLSMLACISRSSNEISIQDADYGIAVANFLTRRMVSLIHGNIATSKHEANVQRVLKIINDAGGVISLNELSRKCQWLPPKERLMITAQLQETNQLLPCGRMTKTKQANGLGTSIHAITEGGWIYISPEMIAEAQKAKQEAGH